MRRGLAALFGASLAAAPVWKAPDTLPFGQMVDLELREEDPSQPPPPRPADERLGILMVRAVEPLADGRGWRLRVQALRTGSYRIPPLDLGNGQKAPELRFSVPRTTPFGARWMGLGGGSEDLLPRMPFPWMWTSFLLLPLLGLAAAMLAAWRRGGTRRRGRVLRTEFQKNWPPQRGDRAALDRAHGAGRALLAQHHGSEALSWGAPDLEARKLPGWALWLRSLDAARFGRLEPEFPAGETLMRELEAPR